MPARPDALVTAEWVAAHLGDPDLRVLYCGRSAEERADYDREHIPGAIFTEGYADFTEDREVRALVPLRETFERTLARLGVTSEHRVLVYAPARSMWPARAYWVLRYFRFPRVHLLDGGNAELRAAGVPLTSEPTPAPEVRDVHLPEPDTSINVTYQDVLAAVEQGTAERGGPIVLDCRSDGEFTGQTHGHAVAARLGRIPRSQHVDWELIVEPSGRFLPLERLRALYAAAGIDGTRPVYPYCGGGIRAAVGWFALHELLGYEHVANYDGSWSEWAQRTELPIETG